MTTAIASKANRRSKPASPVLKLANDDRRGGSATMRRKPPDVELAKLIEARMSGMVWVVILFDSNGNASMVDLVADEQQAEESVLDFNNVGGRDCVQAWASLMPLTIAAKHFPEAVRAGLDRLCKGGAN